MNHRVVANGTPLDARFDTIALAARRAGYEPVLFGYTDQSLDPRLADGPDDPRLSTYNGILPGFDAVLDIPDDHGPWVEWLAALGHDTAPGAMRPAGDRARAPGRAQRVGVPHRSRDRVAASPGRAVVRAPQLPPTAPSVLGRRALVAPRTTRPT